MSPVVLGDLAAPGAPGGIRGHTVRNDLCFPGVKDTTHSQSKTRHGNGLGGLLSRVPHRIFLSGRQVLGGGELPEAQCG